MRLTIVKEAEDRLSDKTWIFYVNDRINKLTKSDEFINTRCY